MGTGDGRFYGFITNNFINEDEMKLQHDQYQVYVGDDLIGRKTLLNQADKLSDIDDFLRSNGIDSFQTSLEGDHYTIQPNEKADKIVKAMEIYFKNR
ncbi:hypothetical protein ACOJQI_10395 [Bacillus salacetis]|uniref:hypothetical protein n=1 Tax=Bacillus salacetis TaxID=2315464 RepID=UPI003BA21054